MVIGVKIGIIHAVKSYGGSVLSLVDLVEMLRHGNDLTVYIPRNADKRAAAAVAETGVRAVCTRRNRFCLPITADLTPCSAWGSGTVCAFGEQPLLDPAPDGKRGKKPSC
jgi:hypothetical protein